MAQARLPLIHRGFGPGRREVYFTRVYTSLVRGIFLAIEQAFRMMDFGMAVRAQQPAFGGFSAERCVAAVGHGPQIQFESLVGWIDMMPNQDCIILLVSATLTASTPFCHQRELAPQAARLLTHVVLMPIVGVAILAPAPAIPALPALQRALADRTIAQPERFLLHV